MILFYRIIRRLNIIIRRIYYHSFRKNIHIGGNLNFRRNFEINAAKDACVFIGNNVFFNNDCSIHAHEKIKIGNHCIFGENVKIYDHNHVFKDAFKPIYEQGFKCSDVVIGDNCWFGSNVVVLAGSRIGNHVVVGAGCIISGDIGSNVIVRLAGDLKIEQIRCDAK